MTEEIKTGAPATLDDLQVGMELRGKVKRIELYGAFVDIGVKTDGLLHISQLGKPNVRNVEDVVKVDEEITVYVLKVDKQAGRIALSMTKPAAVSWDNIHEGDVVTGTVIRLERFGVFVDIGAERPGMIHVSELSGEYVNSPSDVVKVGDEIKAKVIKVDRRARRIDLSVKALTAPAPVEAVQDEPDEKVPTAMELALRRAMESTGRTLPMTKKRDQKRSKADHRRELEEAFERTLRGNQR